MSSRSTNEAAEQACEQFCRFVDSVHGTFLDATFGMGGMAGWYMDTSQARWKELDEAGSLTPDDLNPEVIYGGQVRGQDADLHRTRMHDLIARNSPNGSNWIFLALMCVVALHHMWDEHFRGELARALNVDKDSLKAEIFGEVRHLRNAIIHRLGIASDKVAAAKLTRSFPEGSRLILTPQDLHDLTDMMKESARAFVRDRAPAV
jgi:hypothetical protein